MTGWAGTEVYGTADVGGDWPNDRVLTSPSFSAGTCFVTLVAEWRGPIPLNLVDWHVPSSWTLVGTQTMSPAISPGLFQFLLAATWACSPDDVPSTVWPRYDGGLWSPPNPSMRWWRAFVTGWDNVHVAGTAESTVHSDAAGTLLLPANNVPHSVTATPGTGVLTETLPVGANSVRILASGGLGGFNVNPSQGKFAIGQPAGLISADWPSPSMGDVIELYPAASGKHVATVGIPPAYTGTGTGTGYGRGGDGGVGGGGGGGSAAVIVNGELRIIAAGSGGCSNTPTAAQSGGRASAGGVAAPSDGGPISSTARGRGGTNSTPGAAGTHSGGSGPTAASGEDGGDGGTSGASGGGGGGGGHYGGGGGGVDAGIAGGGGGGSSWVDDVNLTEISRLTHAYPIADGYALVTYVEHQHFLVASNASGTFVQINIATVGTSGDPVSSVDTEGYHLDFATSGFQVSSRAFDSGTVASYGYEQMMSSGVSRASMCLCMALVPKGGWSVGFIKW